MSRTLSVLAAAVCIASSTLAQERVRVSIVETGGTLKSVLAAISKQSGQNLACSAALANEIMIIRVKGADIEEVKAKLASTLVAEWQADPAGRLTLVRTPLLARKAASEMVEVRGREISAKIDAELEKLAKAKPTDDLALTQMVRDLASMFKNNPESNAWERLEEVKRKLPQAGLVYRALKHCNIKSLASLRPGQRIVFSTRPNAIQQPITPSLLAEVRKVAERQADWSKSTRESLPTEEEDFIRYVFPWTASGDVDRLLLICRRGTFEGIRVELRGVDSNGRYILRSDATLAETPVEDYRDLVDPKAPSDGEKVVELTGIAKEFALEVRKRMERGQEGQSISEALKEIIGSPDKFEPISYSCGSLIVGAAEALDMNLVAQSSDNLLFMATMGSGKISANRVLRLIRLNMFDLKVEQSGEWICFRPLDLVSVDANRTPRTVIAPYAKRLANGDALILDEWASLAAKVDCETEAPVLLLMLTAIAGNRSIDSLHNWQQLRFYGQLDVNQRKALAAGKEIAFGFLSPEQKATLSRLIYNEPEIGNEGMQVPAATGDDERILESVSTEVTEIVPNGIPATAQIRYRSESEGGFFADVSYGSGYRANMFLQTHSLAWHLFAAELPDGDAQWRMMIDTVQPATSVNHSFSIQLSKSASQQWTLRDQRRQPGTKKVKVEELPASTKAEIEKLIEEFRKSRVPPNDRPRHSNR